MRKSHYLFGWRGVCFCLVFFRQICYSTVFYFQLELAYIGFILDQSERKPTEAFIERFSKLE